MGNIIIIALIIWFVVLPIYRALTQGLKAAQQTGTGGATEALTSAELRAAAERLQLGPQELLSGRYMEQLKAEALRARAEASSSEAPVARAYGDVYQQPVAAPLDSVGTAPRYRSVEQELSSVEAQAPALESAEPGTYAAMTSVENLTAAEDAILERYRKYLEPPPAEGGTAELASHYERDLAEFGKVEEAPAAPQSRVQQLLRDRAQLRKAFLLKEVLERPY